MYTVKQVAELTELSVRTLHYYDEIGLLKPSRVGDNGYRHYDESALLRLQQILFYRELGLDLAQIKDVLDSPYFNTRNALSQHKATLLARMERLQLLVGTLDDTLMYLDGDDPMSDKKKLFKAFSPEKQKQYEREIRLEYGADKVNESVRRWASYDKAQKQAIMDEGNAIYEDIAKAIDVGLPPNSPEVQDVMVRWHEHTFYFYEPTLEILRGLGELYNDHPDFKKNFGKVHAQLAEYLRDAIVQYVDDLETAEIERMLSDDDDNRKQDSL